MVPVSGFFEYGIAALLGAAVMLGLGIWALVDESAREVNKVTLGDHKEKTISGPPLYKKAA